MSYWVLLSLPPFIVLAHIVRVFVADSPRKPAVDAFAWVLLTGYGIYAAVWVWWLIEEHRRRSAAPRLEAPGREASAPEEGRVVGRRQRRIHNWFLRIVVWSTTYLVTSSDLSGSYWGAAVIGAVGGACVGLWYSVRTFQSAWGDTGRRGTQRPNRKAIEAAGGPKSGPPAAT